MGTRSKEQKERVNDTHCCVCFKLRTAILIAICISIILIFSYGYEYWTNPSSRESSPGKFYGYVCVAGIEFIVNIIGWIAVYNHIRLITKLYTYWIIIHLLIIGIVFWVSTLFDYLHYSLFIVWIVIQCLILFLLWKYKQVLKMVYGWGDDEEPEEEPQEVEAEPIKPEPVQEEPKKDSNGANVNVSINLSMPQQQGAMYQQPMQMQQPMPMQMQPMQPMQMPIQNGYPQQQMQPMQQQPLMGQNGQNQHHQHPNMHQNRSQPDALYSIQANPPNAPHSPVKQKQQQYTQQQLNGLSDVAQQADPPIQSNEESNSDTDQNGQVRISVYSNNGAAIADKIDEEPQEARMNDEIYNTARWQNTNQPAMTGGNNQEGDEGDMIDQQDTNNMDLYSSGGHQTNQKPPQQAYMMDNHNGRPRVKTPDPPPPPNQGVNRYESHASDNAVLDDDFIAEVRPNNHQGQTKGVNLYFLDPGDNVTQK